MNLQDFVYEKNNSGYTVSGLKGNFKNLVIPEGVTKIANYAFAETQIESVTFPSSLVYIGHGAFDWCKNLQSVNFAQSGNLEEIDEYAFASCYSLKEVKIPKSVNYLRLGAFSNCSSLNKVSLYESVQIVKAEAFWGCDSLKSVTVIGSKIPSTWQSEWIEDGVKVCFSSDSDLKTSSTVNTSSKTISNTTAKTSTSSKKQTIKTSSATKTVKNSNDSSNESISKTTTVKVGAKTTATTKTVTQVKTNVTANTVSQRTSTFNSGNGESDNLKSGAITQLNGYTPNSLSDFEIKTSIDGQYIASVRNKNIKTVVVPKEVDVIGSYDDGYVFSNCTSLETFIGHEKLKALWNGAFSGCTSLKTVKLSDDTSVYKYVFSGCTSLETAYINRSCYAYAYADSCVKRAVFSKEEGLVLSEGLFSGSAIESVDLPNNVYYISNRVFYNCKSLKSVKLNEDLSYIMDDAFQYCEKLQEINVPKKVRSIGDNAFYNCTSLKKVTLNEGELYYICNNTFYGCTSLETINIPDCVGAIFGSAFRNCTNLRTVNFSKKGPGLISEYAFYGCENLKEIVIPKGVRTVGDNAFDSRYLKKLTIIRDKNFKPNNSYGNNWYLKWISKENRAGVSVKVIYE